MKTICDRKRLNRDPRITCEQCLSRIRELAGRQASARFDVQQRATAQDGHMMHFYRLPDNKRVALCMVARLTGTESDA